jgi:alpha/beta superfamily hydrolase
VRCPILAVIGAKDVQVCSEDDLEVIRRNAIAAARVDTHVIGDADHFFTGHVTAVAECLVGWTATLT